MLWVALARDGRWEGQTSLPSNTVSGRLWMGAVYSSTQQRIYAFGGTTSSDFFSDRQPLDDFYEIDVTDQNSAAVTWSTLSPASKPSARTKFGFMEGSGWERIITTTCMSTTSRAIALRHLQVVLKSRPFTTLSIALAVVLRPSIRMAVPSMTVVLDLTWTVTTSIPTTSPAIAGPPSAALRIPAFDPLEVLFTCSRRA